MRKDLKDNANDKVIGKFKDVTKRLPITEFVVLNPKCYPFNHFKKDDTLKNTKKAKRCFKDVVKHQLTHDNYMDTMTTNEQLRRDVVSLRSKDHALRTIKNPKIALNSSYDKMKLIDAIECEPFGYTQLTCYFNRRCFI